MVFWSRILAEGQRRTWTAREKETYAIVCALRKWSGHIGLQPVVVCTDHQSLCKGKLRTGQNKVGFFCGPLHLAGSGLQQLCLILFVVHDIAPYKLIAVVRRRCRYLGTAGHACALICALFSF